MYKKLVSYWSENTYLDYILIALVASHTLIWFQDGMLYFQGDAGIPYNPAKNLTMLYTWWERQGGIESWGFSQTFTLPFFALLEKLGVSLVASQDIYIYLARAVAGCSMYYLSSTFTTSRFASLLSAFIYLFSPFQLGLITIYVYLPYVFMPLVLGLYVKGLNNKSKAHLLLSSIVLIALTCDFPNYRHYLIAIALLMLYSVYYALCYSWETKGSIKYTLGALTLVGLTNILLTLWISLPVYSLLAGVGVSSMLANIGIDFGDYGWATILNIIRLRGSASLESGGAVYATNLLKNPIIIISSFYLPVIAFTLLLFRRKLDRSVYFLLVVSVLFLFIAKGTNPPLGGIYKWVVLNVPLARAFKTSWLSILPVVMAYSILASISIHLIYQCLSKKKKLYGYYFIAFSVVHIFLSSYPLITGGYIQSIFSPTNSGSYIIPHAYYEMEEYLTENLQSGNRFIRIPESGGYINTIHSWNYAGSNITPFIFSEHSYIDGYMLANSSSAILNRLYEKIRNYQFDEEFEILLRVFNIRYILVDGYEENYGFYLKIPQFKNRLLQNRRITFVKQADRLYLYKFDSKEKLEEYGKILSQKLVSYLFYMDKEKVENMLKDKEKLEDIKLKGDNPFKIGTQKFYVPEDGSYSIKGLVTPKRDFIISDFVSSSSSSRASLDVVSSWDIRALNTMYKQSISEDGMRIDAYFHGRGDVKESVILTKKFSDINIKERPYLAFSWEMEDLGVQEVEIDIKFIDLNSKMTLKVSDKQYVINLYEKAKDERLKAEGKNLLVEEVILKFKKKDGVDVSDERKREVYAFIFKNIAFLKHQPILAEFEDKLSAYLPDKFYYFDENGNLRGVDFPEQIPSWDVKDVYRLHIQRFIDLKETPVLSLNYPKPAIENNMNGERSTFPAEWKVVMGLDFDEDGKEDNVIETFVPVAGVIDGKLLLTIRSYEEAKKRFPNKRNYNLLSIGISHPDDKEIIYQTAISKKLVRHSEYRYKPSDFKIGDKVLELDGKIYNLPLEAKGKRQKVKDEENNSVEFNNIQLEEGEHSLNVFGNDRFKVEMVEIKPISSISSIGFISSKERQEPPKIEFRKINPTRYIVDAKGAKGPFTLVFSESFHEGWKAYVRQKADGKRQEAEDEPWSALWSAWRDKGNRAEIRDHFVVNGYANGWIVPARQFKVQSEKLKVEEKDLQNFEIVLEYKPQRLFEIGLLISGTTLLVCIGYLGYGWVSKR